MTELLPEDRRRVDLAAEALGGRVVFANDEFFAEASNLFKPQAPEWREGVYTEVGKWMDGWETRRRRKPGNDFCMIALGAPGTIRDAVIETTHFRGNQPEAFALHGLTAAPDAPGELLIRSEAWTELLPRTPLDPDAVHRFEVVDAPRVSHVQLSIFPDGGVARLRLFGVAQPDWGALTAAADLPDVAGLVNGGLVIAVSDETFGEPQNMLLPEPSTHMGQGWETRRRRGPGHDWAVIRLGHRSSIECVRLETDHFKGNYPEAASLEWCDLGSGSTVAASVRATDPPDGAGDVPGGPESAAGEIGLLPAEEDWRPLVTRSPLGPNATHQWISELEARGPATHVRLNIFPDGGVARLRVFGKPAPGA